LVFPFVIFVQVVAEVVVNDDVKEEVEKPAKSKTTQKGKDKVEKVTAAAVKPKESKPAAKKVVAAAAVEEDDDDDEEAVEEEEKSSSSSSAMSKKSAKRQRKQLAKQAALSQASAGGGDFKSHESFAGMGLPVAKPKAKHLGGGLTIKDTVKGNGATTALGKTVRIL
jgi:hypothetical protein